MLVHVGRWCICFIITSLVFFLPVTLATAKDSVPVTHLGTFSNKAQPESVKDEPLVTVMLWTYGDAYIGMLRYAGTDKMFGCGTLRDVLFLPETGDISIKVSVTLPDERGRIGGPRSDRHLLEFTGTLSDGRLSGWLLEASATQQSFSAVKGGEVVLDKQQIEGGEVLNYATHEDWFAAHERRLNECAPIVPPPPVVGEEPGPFDDRLAISLFLGSGIPMGSFADPTRGNHDSGALNYLMSAEYFVHPMFAFGFGVWGGSYKDKTVGGESTTKLTTNGVMARYNPVTEGLWGPFLQVGAGLARLSFFEFGSSFAANSRFAYFAAGGVQLRLSHILSLSGRISFYHVLSDGARVPLINGDVNFDTRYYAFDVGVSVFSF